MRFKINGYVKLLMIITCIYFLILSPFLIANHPVVLDYDVIRQQQTLYYEFHNLLDSLFKNGAMPFYSWNYFLGTDFFSSKAFYLTGDIFAWFSYFLKSFDFYSMMVILNYLKFIIAGLLMFTFLKHIKLSERTSLIGALLYTFSSYIIYFQNQSQFISFYALMPLIFIGIERFFNKKYILFILSTTLLCFTNFYSFFALSLFLPFYFIYRYGSLYNNYHKFITSTLKIIGLYILGILISSILFVPAIIFILNNNRVGLTSFNPLFYENIKTYVNIVASYFLPTNIIYLSSSSRIFDVGLYSLDELFSFTTSLVPLVVIYILISQNKRILKIKNLSLFLYFLITLFVPFANMVLHGFSEPSFRSNIFLVFISILVTCSCLDKHSTKSLNSKVLHNSLIYVLVIIIFLIPTVLSLTGSLLSDIYNPQNIVIFASCITFTILFVIALKKNSKFILVLVIVQISFSQILYANNTLHQYKKEDYQYINNITNSLEQQSGELKTYLDSLHYNNPYEFYRILLEEGTVYDWGNLNTSVLYGIKSLSSYDSTYSTSINELIRLEPSIEDFRSINILDPNLIDFLSTKYAIVGKNSTFCSSSTDWFVIEEGFQSNYMICENKNYKPFGIPYSKVITTQEYINAPNTNLFNNNIISALHDKDIIEEKVSNDKIELRNIYYKSNYLNADILTEQGGFIVITIPYDEGWTIYIDGNDTPYYTVNGGFIGIPIPENASKLTMHFTPRGFKIGIILSLLGLTGLCVVIIKQRKEGNKCI